MFKPKRQSLLLRLGSIILSFLTEYHHKYNSAGDLEEEYRLIRKDRGRKWAFIWYWEQILVAILQYACLTLYWRSAMFKNNLKISLRKMNRQKMYTLINVLGLAIGMAGAMFILIWVRDERSYDRFHADAHRIYRVSKVHHVNGKNASYTNTPAILAETLMLECPEVELATSVRGDREGTLVGIEDRQYHENHVGIADDLFFRVFTFPFTAGDQETALVSPQTVVISQQAANRYFGEADPIGRMLTIYDDDFVITGVFEDMPPNSHFHFDIICSKNSFGQWLEPDWSWNPFKTYVRIHGDADIPALQNKLNDIAITRMCGDDYAGFLAKGNSKSLPLQALTDIHLNSHMLGEFEANGNATHVQFFTIIAGFILLIAAVNYTNLSTARSTGRALEVGIRKTVGSSRTSLIRQFLSESVLTSLVALILALIAITALMPAFRQLVGKSWLDIPYMQSPILILPMVLLTIMIGLSAGMYPSLFLSSVAPITVLGGKFSPGMKRSRLRNSLVVLQFSLSVLLLTGTLVVRKQMAYVQNQDLGFEREHVVVLQTLGQIDQRLPVFKKALLNNPDVIDVSASSSVPGKEYLNVGFHVVGSHDSWPATICIAADADYLKVMQLEMEDGRFFDEEIISDRRAVILNTNKARAMGIDDLYEQRIQIGSLGEAPFHVIGIVGDFHYESFHEPVKPMGIVMLSEEIGWSEDYVSVRIRPENIKETIAFLQRIWENFIPGSPFVYSFLDSIYDDMYRNELRTGRIFTLFTVFTLFVACLGLLGLTSYAAEQRRKEFGIRKTLGATTSGIILLLSKEYQKLILIANGIAWPIAYLLMKRWLQSFVYRTSIGILTFLAAGFLVLAITSLAVIYHSLKAASANPVESLRYE